MSLFNLFFPPQAQVTQLRLLAVDNPPAFIQLRSRQIAEEKEKRQKSQSKIPPEEQIARLQDDLNQSSLVIESLILLLEKRSVLNRDELEAVFRQVDPADGKTGPTRVRKDDFSPPRAWRPH